MCRVGQRLRVPVGARVAAPVGTRSSGATLLSIAVTPDVTMIGTTETQQMTATGHYTSGPDADITGSVTWQSATGATCTIAAGGLVTAVAGGTSVITATLGAVSGTTTMCVAPKDATSAKFCPLTQNDWKAVFARASKLVGYTIAEKTVSQSWALQDASGNPAATIGTACTAYGTLTYNEAVSGWTRTALRNPVSTTAGFGLNTGVGPNAGTGSVLWFCIVDIVGVAGATRSIMNASNAGTNNCYLRAVQTTGVLRVGCVNVNVDGTLDHSSGGARPLTLTLNRTSTFVNGSSDIETIDGTYNAAVADNLKGYPANGTIVGANAAYLLGAAFAGAHAEWTDGSGGTALSRHKANVKAVYQALGFTVTGY